MGALSLRARLLLLLALIAGLYALGHFSGALEGLNAEKIKRVVIEAGPWGFAVYLALYAGGTLVQAPGMLFVAGASLVWGPNLGFVLALVGSLIAVSINFAVGRNVGGDALTRVKYKWFRKALDKLDRYPIRTMIVLRLVMWIAPPLNYTLALSGVRYRDYLAAAAIGLILPIYVATAVIDSLIGAM